ncbi:hypothetical protein DFR30_1832 [Thiogranum longum]|uniref:Glyoxalase n=1 Tax=Thiogranum longum TaxID=1537524 RepID=A0A4R1H9I7_9GAMM|nr:hypothetical protein DFR30_1832 [Thiogranum longum]
MNEHEKINYVEFPSSDIEFTKDFFKQVFGWSFPGGRRFHFTEPSGNEFAVWSDINA